MIQVLIWILIIVLLGGGIWWRYAVRHHTLPCPSWLSIFLENPYMNALAGSYVIIERLQLSPGLHVLDAGCGTGRLTIPIAKAVGPEGEVVALDIQSTMLDNLRRKTTDNNLMNIIPILGGLGEGKLAENVFDRALLVTVLGEIQNRQITLREIYNALKPGGILSITEVIPDPHYQSIKTVKMLVESVGFKIDQVFGSWFVFTINFIKP